jgi:carboxypeptidase Taq
MSDSFKDYEELIAKYKEYSVLGSVTGLLHWDMQAMMPHKGIERRTDQLSLLSGMMHKMLTSEQIGELLDKLDSSSNTLTEEMRANVREIRHDYQKATKIPVELVEEMSREQSLCHEVWVKAREAADFQLFAPNLEKVVKLVAKMAEYLGYKDTPLDALIDQFEPDATTAMFTKLFDDVKAANVPLLKKILASPVKAKRDFLKTEYPPELQKQIGLDIMKQIGFDMEAGRLDTSVHPFCAGGTGDVRITTRYNPHAPQQAIFGIIHESGHAMYEQGVNRDFWGTPLAEALSYGIHESQSRLWENFVGRGRPFWKHFLPKLQSTFGTQLAGVKLDDFMLAINHVEQSPVRVEADELTYDLHIILRFEIERDLFAGKISISDLPKVWNSKMEEYLGITPANDGKEGVMQDVHWSGGSFGYFPSYSLGNMAAGQFWFAMQTAIPNMDAKMESGDFSDILHWLRENVHLHGRRFKRDELMQRATGKPLGTASYIKYLSDKYSALYKL